MKIVLIAGASSIHCVRWANGLCAAGHEVHVITQHPAVDSFEKQVVVHQLPFRGVLGYFTMVPKIRQILSVLKPDIVNAHYASGYGTTARLVGHSPWILSVWGSDVYDFPQQGALKNWLVKRNLAAADAVASTSHCMAEQARSLMPAPSRVVITPFGVDLTAFGGVLPITADQKRRVTIGTVKSMEPKYGVDTLIEAFAILRDRFRATPPERRPEIELRLVGGGREAERLRALAQQLGVQDDVHFIGRVPHAEVPSELAKLDIYAALSRLDSESFGVAVIEAGAAGRPVVVSDAGGLPEVTVDGETGFVVRRDDPEAAAVALEKLVCDAELRYRMGRAAQKHVARHYAWSACIETMLSAYTETIEEYSKNQNRGRSCRRCAGDG